MFILATKNTYRIMAIERKGKGQKARKRTTFSVVPVWVVIAGGAFLDRPITYIIAPDARRTKSKVLPKGIICKRH
jgi:hypothetical protein